MTFEISDILFLNQIFIPTILGLFIGYWAGYRHFRTFPLIVFILILLTFSYTCFITVKQVRLASDDNEITSVLLTTIIHIIIGIIAGGFSGRHLRNFGHISYVVNYARSTAVWFLVTIIFDGIIKSLLLFQNIQIFKEVVFLSLMALIPSITLFQKFANMKLHKTPVKFHGSNLVIIVFAKGVFSFSGFVRDQIAPSWLWLFDNYPCPVLYVIFITFCFSAISSFWDKTIFND